MSQQIGKQNISEEAITTLIASGAAAFFGTMAAMLAKGYNFDLANMTTTPFGWLTVFTAIAALAAAVAFGTFIWILWTNRGSFIGYSVKVLLGVWAIAISAAVALIIFRMFYQH